MTALSPFEKLLALQEQPAKSTGSDKPTRWKETLPSNSKGDYRTLRLVEWLRATGHYGKDLGGGKHSIHCPNAKDHSNDPGAEASDTVMWEAGPGGYPGFHCFHDHCRDWTLFRVIEAIGRADEFCDARFQPERAQLATRTQPESAIENSTASDPELLNQLKGEGDHGPSEESLAWNWAQTVKEKWAFFEGGQWYRYKAGFWKYSSQERAETEVQHWLVNLRDAGVKVAVTARKVSNVLRLARAYLGPHENSELNSRPNLIPLANGVYDLDSSLLLPHSPQNWLTHHFPISYDAGASCPRWLQFIREVMLTVDGKPCQEWIDTLQEWFGYCLIPDNRAQVSMVWVGEGQNGKGVATRLLEAMVGSAQTIAVPVEQLHDPYHRAELQGKLVGFVNEPDPRAMVRNGAHFKAITGGDAISARRPTEKVFTFIPYCRLVISCNSIPQTRDLTHGYFRRLRLIEWRYDVSEEKKDTDLDAVLRSELSGILNWALAGLRRFQERNLRFAPSPESDRLLSAYKLSEDTLAQFIAEECECGDGFSVIASVFYDAYTRWCKDNGHPRAETATKVGRDLGKRFGCDKATDHDAANKSIKIRVGIRICADSRYAPDEPSIDPRLSKW